MQLNVVKCACEGLYWAQHHSQLGRVMHQIFTYRATDHAPALTSRIRVRISHEPFWFLELPKRSML